MNDKLVVPFFTTLLCLAACAVGWLCLYLDWLYDIRLQLLLAPHVILAAIHGPHWKHYKASMANKTDGFELAIIASSTALATIPQVIYWLI